MIAGINAAKIYEAGTFPMNELIYFSVMSTCLILNFSTDDIYVESNVKITINNLNTGLIEKGIPKQDKYIIKNISNRQLPDHEIWDLQKVVQRASQVFP